jgi:hypothetical protein
MYNKDKFIEIIEKEFGKSFAKRTISLIENNLCWCIEMFCYHNKNKFDLYNKLIRACASCENKRRIRKLIKKFNI